MKKSRQRTLIWRLGAVLMTMQIAVAIVLAGYAVAMLRPLPQVQTEQELRSVTPLLADLLRDDLLRNDPVALSASVDRISDTSGLRITLVDLEGAVLADSHHDSEQMESHRFREEIDDAIQTGAGSRTRFSRTLGTDMMYYAHLVRDGEQPIVVLRTSKPLTTVNAELAHVLRLIGLAAVLLILLTLGVTYWVSRRVSASVKSLADAASRFAAGDLSHRITPPPGRELASLGDALNDMAGRLASQFDQLETQRAGHRAILQSMSNGVIALDLKQQIITVNHAAEAMFSLDAKRDRGRLLQEVIRQPTLHQLVRGALHGPTRGTAEFQLDDARRTTIRVVSQALVDSDDKVKGLLLLFDDVTELRKLESLRADFASNVSHELRTPVTNIKGYVETLQEVGWEDAEQANRFLEIIRKNSGRLMAIIEDVMALSTLEQPGTRESIELTTTPLATIVGAAISQFEMHARDKGIAVLNRVSPDLKPLVQPQLIEQAVGNLISNAIKYSPARTQVSIDAESIDGEVILSIRDQGAGIAPAHIPRLFERFYRIDKARSRDLGGTGLGLAIVKHIALVHGGRIEVVSEIGKGSTFSLHLPDKSQ
jgi:two-component system phosphate regulon sensor histidine kinase PhoR